MGKENPFKKLEQLHYLGADGGVNPPITDSSTFVFESAETMAETFEKDTGNYLYARHSTPTSGYLSKSLATMEATEAAQVTASGMGAISSVILQLCKTGDHVICGRTVYGGTYALLKNFVSKLGIATTFVDTSQKEFIEAAIQPNTRLIICETLSNPMLEVANLPMMAQLAKAHGLKLVVDNTFAPLVVTPHLHGADVVIHSLTKYVNGSGDTIGGVVCGTEDFINQLRDVNSGATMLLGPTMDNFRAAQILKNLQTLHVRIIQHSHNAQYLATKFEEAGFKVSYPGLKSHPFYKTLKALGNPEFGNGGMFTIDAGTKKRAFALMEEWQKVGIGTLAVSLGHHKTLFSSPGTGTSSEIPEKERLEMGLTDSLVRFSTGLDLHIEDTWNNIKKTL